MKRKLFQLLRRTRVYTPEVYNPLPNRLNWEQIEARPRQEGNNVVKGTSKRVVVVKSPDSRVFEQAIFIVREDFLSHHREGDRKDILREAQDVANRYIQSTVPPARPWTPLTLPLPARIGAAGAAAAALVWAVLHFAFGLL